MARRPNDKDERASAIAKKLFEKEETARSVERGQLHPAVNPALIPPSDDIEIDSRAIRPREIRGEFPLPPGDSIEDSVRAFLKENFELLKLESDPQSLKLTQDVTTSIGRVFRFQQLHKGIEVLDCTVLVRLDSSNRVKLLALGNVLDVVVKQPKGKKKISAKAARKRALKSVGRSTLRQKPSSAARIFFPARKGLQLAYLVRVLTLKPLHTWEIVVNAYTSAILKKRDLIMEVDGRGFVFNPNPVVSANNLKLRDPDAKPSSGFHPTQRATIDNERKHKRLLEITQGAMCSLNGPYAVATNLHKPNTQSPTEVDPNKFDYPSGDKRRRFEAVNVYYHIDTLQRYIQKTLEIYDANKRPTPYDPYDNSRGGHSAFYDPDPSDKGLHFGDSKPNPQECRPDRAEDGHCIVHEYGHAIQDDLVDCFGKDNQYESAATSEGFGDALACIFFAPMTPRKPKDLRPLFESWVFADRPKGKSRRVDGKKVYRANSKEDRYEKCKIWSSALWNIYLAIGGESTDKHKQEAARDALLKTLISSYKPNLLFNSTMPQSAKAMMDVNAELEFNDIRGKHLMEMLKSFHDRGLLRSQKGKDVDLDIGNVGDCWIRNQDDGRIYPIHEEPIHTKDNWFYARVTNHGTDTARAFVVTFNVLPLAAGSQFRYPDDFKPFISAAPHYDLKPGESTIVKAKWSVAQWPPALIPLPGTRTQACLFVSAYSPKWRPQLVGQNHNLARKNVTCQ